MKCPKCGQELKDGKLYCETCGEEIHIVPDFEPEIENKIEETLLDVAQKLQKEEIAPEEQKASEGDITESIPYVDEDLPDDDFWDVNEVIHFNHSKNIKKNVFSLWEKSIWAKIIICLSAIIIVFLIVICICLINDSMHNNSYDYQVACAMKAYEDENYDEAVAYLEHAMILDSSDIDMKYRLADYYYQNGQTDNAILTLKELISINGDNVEDCYAKLFHIYEKENNVEEISRMLSDCTDTVILEQFQQYIANMPEYSVEEGSYGDVVPLKLTANTTGTIYYTLDGTMPDESSPIYTSPIFLESGYYTVKSVFINSYGLMSEVATKRYEINVTVPITPVVNLESGTFTAPEMIIVEVPDECTTYYTIDGTSPTKDSNLYKGPICMPLGTSQFAFITYSKENVPSEVSIKVYTLELNDISVSPQDAANLVTNYRFSLGGLLDTQGHLASISGRLIYLCESAVSLNDGIFYVVSEYYEDPVNLVQTKTGLQYGVSINDPNKVGTLETDAEGFYYLVESAQEE